MDRSRFNMYVLEKKDLSQPDSTWTNLSATDFIEA